MRRHIITSAIAGLAMLAAVIGTVGAAEAAGPRVPGPTWKGQTWQGPSVRHHGPRVVDTAPSKVFLPRYVYPSHPIYPGYPGFRPGYPYYPGYGYGYGMYSGGYAVYPDYTTPSTVYVPSYVYVYPPAAPAPPTSSPLSSADRQWVPGHWAYKWTPDGGSGKVWVPGYYDTDGVWVAGSYKQAAPGQPGDGTYQPYWIEGYWSP